MKCSKKNQLHIYNENCEGKYFVTEECIACDTCTEIAPKTFKLTLDYDHAYVFLQPKSTDETLECESALDACPVAAIGKH